MPRSAVLFIACCIAAGCSPASDREGSDAADEHDPEDGGTHNAQRVEAQSLLAAIARSASVDEERQRVTECAAWLNEHDYTLQVEEQADGMYRLLCPHFPPVTPSIDHTFHDPVHLKLLPRLEQGP